VQACDLVPGSLVAVGIGALALLVQARTTQFCLTSTGKRACPVVVQRSLELAYGPPIGGKCTMVIRMYNSFSGLHYRALRSLIIATGQLPENPINTVWSG
jgi:hypothetical protein